MTVQKKNQAFDGLAMASPALKKQMAPRNAY
jgi:hypothetical protein